MIYGNRLALLGVLVLMTQVATAGPLYGTVRIGAAPASGVQISVACPTFSVPAHTSPPVMTDANGSYSLLVRATGSCQMQVSRGDQVGAAFEVFVSDNPLRFDFQIDAAFNRVP